MPANSETSFKLNRTVFLSASVLIAMMVVMTAVLPKRAETFFKWLQGQLIESAGWFYVLVVAVVLMYATYFALSRHGRVKLGPDHAAPDYSLPSWFAMLFSAGIGIGLLFFGVAEPVMHYMSPPDIQGQTLDAAREAMNITFFHWGLHAWAIYAIVGLALSYYGYRHNHSLTLRSALRPIFGDRVEGLAGDAVDTFAIIGTVLGVATSMGFGVAQINAGLGYLVGIDQSITLQIVIIIVVTIFATLSVLSGLDKGVKRLSEINMILAFALMAFVLLAGPTLHLIQMLVQNTGTYLSGLVAKTFNMYAYEPTDWIGGWTLFYWGWWISWSPFVGMFIARISRGRTIREFILGVIFIPSGFTFAWMTIFGNSAIDIILTEGLALANQVESDNAIALFQFLHHLPLSNLVSGIAVVMIVVFFVTSADSGALVVNMLCAHGNENTPKRMRIYWTGSIGLVAAVLLLAGGLSALQTATIASALPFAVIILLMLFGLQKSLSIDAAKRETLQRSAMLSPNTSGDDNFSWRDRLDNIASLPKAKRVAAFINNDVRLAMKAVSDELVSRGMHATTSSQENRQDLIISHGEEQDFLYSVRLREMEHPDFDEEGDREHYYRADVYLAEGGRDYDIMGYSREHIINDILDQYEKHRQFLDSIR